MSCFRSIAAKLFDRPRVEADMEELCSHIEHRADDLERSGIGRREAERRRPCCSAFHPKISAVPAPAC